MGERNYCIIVMDNTTKVEEDLGFICSEPLNVINNGKDTVLIATFKTPLSPINIKKALNVGNKRSFFIFELNAETCATYIDEKDMQNFLFSTLDIDSESLIEEENRVFLKEFNNLNMPYEYDEEKLSSLNEKERELMIDKLLNNVKNLTNNQKKALSFLANL